MNVIFSYYGNKIGVNYLVWDMGKVTAKEIISFWKLLLRKEVFHNPPPGVGKFRNVELAKIKALLKDETLVTEIAYCLSLLVSGTAYNDKEKINNPRNRLVFHMVSHSVGYETKTERIFETVSVSCRSVGYFHSFGKAIRNELHPNDKFRDHDCGWCGCDLVRRSVKRETEYDDDTTMWFYPQIAVATNIIYKEKPHQKSVVELLLNQIQFFPNEINFLICSFL